MIPHYEQKGAEKKKGAYVDQILDVARLEVPQDLLLGERLHLDHVLHSLSHTHFIVFFVNHLRRCLFARLLLVVLLSSTSMVVV
jgi:hypothetical protein